MKKIILLISLCVQLILNAHTGHLNPKNLKIWKNNSENKSILGTFYYTKGQDVFIEATDGKVVKMNRSELSAEMQNYVDGKIAEIAKINQKIQIKHLKNQQVAAVTPSNLNLIGLGLFAVAILFLINLYKIKHLAFTPIFSVVLLVSILSFANGNVVKRGLSTSPTFMDSAFSYFKPTINTRWDNQYFYVESNGIADHEMMLGITSWQQQVPIPQCYIGSNAWSIPLNPVIANTPVPVNNQHFLRGAVAIAVNGIAIFNPYTNTGVDAFLDGQLDQYGGHSGRADDYHYHIAPVVLYNKIPKTSPIAFALDGFAIYGDIEPDGSAMKALDANHGHYGSNGLYHYHSSNSAPYMIGKMVGKVTEDTTLQIIPQATAKGVRPALTPLKGATITHCHKYTNAMGYILTYTLNSQKDTVDYSWTSAGQYTYKFKVNGSTTTNNYNGQKICVVPQTSGIESFENADFVVYPNPASEVLNFKFPKNIDPKSIQSLLIYNVNGSVLQTVSNHVNSIDLKYFSKGIYFLKLNANGQSYTTKFIVR